MSHEKPARETTLSGLATAAIAGAIAMLSKGDIGPGAALAMIGITLLYIKYKWRVKN